MPKAVSVVQSPSSFLLKEGSATSDIEGYNLNLDTGKDIPWSDEEGLGDVTLVEDSNLTKSSIKEDDTIFKETLTTPANVAIINLARKWTR